MVNTPKCIVQSGLEGSQSKGKGKYCKGKKGIGSKGRGRPSPRRFLLEETESSSSISSSTEKDGATSSRGSHGPGVDPFKSCDESFATVSSKSSDTCAVGQISTVVKDVGNANYNTARGRDTSSTSESISGADSNASETVVFCGSASTQKAGTWREGARSTDVWMGYQSSWTQGKVMTWRRKDPWTNAPHEWAQNRETGSRCWQKGQDAWAEEPDSMATWIQGCDAWTQRRGVGWHRTEPWKSAADTWGASQEPSKNWQSGGKLRNEWMSPQEVQQLILRLCGTWSDTNGSSYRLTEGVKCDSLDVSTKRPSGATSERVGLIHIEWKAEHGRVVWGRGGNQRQYTLAAFDGQTLAWQRPGSPKFEWKRSDEWCPSGLPREQEVSSPSSQEKSSALGLDSAESGEAYQTRFQKILQELKAQSLSNCASRHNRMHNDITSALATSDPIGPMFASEKQVLDCKVHGRPSAKRVWVKKHSSPIDLKENCVGSRSSADDVDDSTRPPLLPHESNPLTGNQLKCFQNPAETLRILCGEWRSQDSEGQPWSHYVLIEIAPGHRDCAQLVCWSTKQGSKKSTRQRVSCENGRITLNHRLNGEWGWFVLEAVNRTTAMWVDGAHAHMPPWIWARLSESNVEAIGDSTSGQELLVYQ